jgi:hypothetical protein
MVGGGGVAGGNTVAQRPPTCSICKQVGHTRAQYLTPPAPKQSKAVFILFDDNDMGQIRPSKRKKKDSVVVAAEDWI